MPRHRLFITTLTEDPLTQPPQEGEPALLAALSAGVRKDVRFAPSPARGRRYWIGPAALLLHAAVIALFFISFVPKPAPEASQQGVSVVFDNGGTQATTAPPAPQKTMATQATTPPPPAPPPPTPQDQQPEVNLNLPTAEFGEMPPPQQAPQQLPQPQPKREVQHVERRQPRHSQYQVMNNMSLGNGSSPQPAPSFTGKPGLNLQLSQSDLNSMIAPQISVEGNIGQDWMDGFNKWVNDHIYYPQAAVENNQQGTSVIQFTVHRDGSVTGVHLLSSAGSTFLDQAWLGIFLHNNVPAFPVGTKSDTIKITAALQYELLPP
jgi:protein TonB